MPPTPLPVLVAPITRTVRAIPTEVSLDAEEGLPHECAAVFDGLQPVPKWGLVQRIGGLSGARAPELCAALKAIADC